MKTIIGILTLVLIFGQSLYAGPGHHHRHGKGAHVHKPKISQEKAKKTAQKHILRLIGESKLEASWETATHISSEKKKFKKKREWVVTFINENASDKSKKKLYVFLSLMGGFIAANHTGK